MFSRFSAEGTGRLTRGHRSCDRALLTRPKAKEKGTLAYLAHQRKDDPTTFIFYEKYASDADLATHGKNLASVGAQFGALLAGAPQIVYLEEI